MPKAFERPLDLEYLVADPAGRPSGNRNDS